jgi:hypothetical protein
MLSISKGTPIALILNDKQKQKDLKRVYISGSVWDNELEEPELDTTPENKLKIFRSFLKLDKKLTTIDIDKMTNSFNQPHLEGPLSRKFEQAKEYVKLSLKKYIDFGKTENLFPIVESLKTKSIRLFISGQSGSGKSYFISEFLKYNQPKGMPVFIFSPFKADKSVDSIKNLIYIDLDEFEAENQREFETPDDIPDDSIIIFDDIDSHRTRAKELQKIRDIYLEIGRHHNISVLTISHNPMGGVKTKASIRESQYAVVFPRANQRDTTKLLETYFGYTKKMVDEVLNCTSRWVFISKSVPSYFVFEHGVRLW